MLLYLDVSYHEMCSALRGRSRPTMRKVAKSFGDFGMADLGLVETLQSR